MFAVFYKAFRALYPKSNLLFLRLLPSFGFVLLGFGEDAVAVHTWKHTERIFFMAEN